jgi:hypothetical protein
MIFWYVALGVSVVLAAFAGFKWNAERHGLKRPRTLRNYGPSAIGAASLAVIIVIRIATHTYV